MFLAISGKNKQNAARWMGSYFICEIDLIRNLIETNQQAVGRLNELHENEKRYPSLQIETENSPGPRAEHGGNGADRLSIFTNQKRDVTLV